MDFVDKGAGGVDDLEVFPGGFESDGRRHAVRREEHGGSVWNLFEGLDEAHAACRELLDDMGVVDNGVEAPDGGVCAKGFVGNSQGSGDPRAESVRLGDSDGCHGVSGWCAKRGGLWCAVLRATG